MIYEMWALGMPMTYVLAFAGGERWKKFEMFPDLILRTPKDLEELLSWKIPTEARRSLTGEVMQAFRDVHNGQGAKIAADVIEGTR